MVQQLNLYDASLRPRRERWRAVHAAWTAAGVIAAAVGFATLLDSFGHAKGEEAAALERQVADERQLAQRNGPGRADAIRTRSAELERLRALESGQRRVHALIDRQVAGRAEGYSPYFLALSRQAGPQLWITGFGVGADGEALEIQGRMVDPAALPEYLRRLNTEPQFKGRSFAQLSMKSAELRGEAASTSSAAPAAGVVDFVLRSQAPAQMQAQAATSLLEMVR